MANINDDAAVAMALAAAAGLEGETIRTGVLLLDAAVADVIPYDENLYDF